MSTKLFISLVLLLLASSVVFGQSWESAYTTGLTSVYLTKTGFEYTMVLKNLTGIPSDTGTVGWDLLVWSLEPFNLPAPETILQMPDGWSWDGGKWKMFEITDNNQKYYTPPALAPGGSYTFRYTSTLTTPANPGGPENGDPGFLSHVASIDSSVPGSATVKWTPYKPDGYPSQTWSDKSTIETPEPGSVMALVAGLAGISGYVIRRKRAR